MFRFLLDRSRVGAIFVGVCVLLGAAQQSWALGLGEIELKSALNQEFKATIDLLDSSGLEPGEILVSLGSSEDFDRVGVERFFFLTDLDFEVVYGSEGQAQISVTSSRPITEPYLNFLVEVLWPSGRLLKEYTVLLDPPTFSQAAAPTVSAPAQNRDSVTGTGRVQRQAAVSPATSGTRVDLEAQRPAQPSPLDQGRVGDEYGMTDRDDTLWSIAARTRPSGQASIQQTMLAIQELNPEAFINGNINLLKAGYVLRLPDEQQVLARTNNQAIAEVAQQNQEWRARARGEPVAPRGEQIASTPTDETSDLRSPVDATSERATAPAPAATDGELRIVAEDGDSTTGVGTAPGAEMTAALEETDRLSRQVDELTYALDREKEVAANELEVKERQIEVKDQQIAELQAQLAAAREQQAQVAAAPPPAGSQNQDQSTPPEPQGAWWESPLVLYGGAGALVLLLVGGMMAARRRREDEETVYFDDDEESFADEVRREPELADATVVAGGFEDEDEDVLEEVFDEEDATRVQTAESAEDELEGSQTSDVIGEADIYIAYGRYPQAVALLEGVLADDPGRNDVRLKLLEVHAENGDREAFDENMGALVEHCDEEEALLAARELESRFGESAISLDDMLAENAADGGEDETSTRELEVTAAVEEPADDDAGAMDFELELDELDESEADRNGGDLAAVETEAEAEGSGDELGGDLGIDFNPDEDEAPADTDTREVAAAEHGFDDDSDEMQIDQALEDAASEFEGGRGFDAGSATAGAATEDALDDLEFETVATADDDFEFQDEGDSANTKLDLARAYIDMGDADGARDILKEVLDEGNSEQQQKAQSMLESL